ncbi:unnamed protein product [Rhizophagus irregularis]|nr:unnamed protein product [Rhizophagus irregularis]
MSRRKRSVSALLSNNEESITARSSRKSRAISRAIDEESEESTSIIHTHDRRMVPCNYSKCNGKIVDIRTKLNHEADRDSDDDQNSEVVQDYSNPLPSSFEDYSNPLPSSSEDYSNPLPSSSEDYCNPLPSSSEDYGNPLPEDNPVSSDEDSDNNRNVIQRMEMEEIDDLSTDLLRRQRSRRYANQQAIITEEEIPLELFITDEESSETDEESNETDE